MSQALYYIVEEDDRWYVRHSGAEYPYASRAIAISAAIDAANTSGIRGHIAQVLEPCPDADWRPVWSYGTDAYPPEQ